MPTTKTTRAKRSIPAPTQTAAPQNSEVVRAANKAAPAPKGKLGVMAGLLARPEGARISELMTATGWQAHSVRGAIAGSLKKSLGPVITSEKAEGGRVYRIAAIKPA